MSGHFVEFVAEVCRGRGGESKNGENNVENSTSSSPRSVRPSLAEAHARVLLAAARAGGAPALARFSALRVLDLLASEAGAELAAASARLPLLLPPLLPPPPPLLRPRGASGAAAAEAAEAAA